MTFRSTLLFSTALILTSAGFAQTSAARQPNPPAPPRTDAPGAPINPRQAGAPAQPVTNAAPQEEQAAAAEAPNAPMRDLKFADADADGDKKVSLTEFSNYIGNRPANSSTEPVSTEMIERFRQLDQDGDAMLSEMEANSPAPVPQQVPSQPVGPTRVPRG